ncbi:MAG TPA: COX15/CtaA family protein [Chloroflexota bacterium]|jgi:cytochrome c oxidase assembly protein subunit 15|nr:COX15/CtaA family protein [Chloroflexota bacterium]
MLALLRGLMLATTFTTIFAAFMGSYVRGNGAGLACPDWPLCYGQVVPEFDWWIFLEWFHRMVVGLVSLMLATAAALIWWKRLPDRWLSLAAVSMLLVQAVMGGLTVILKTNPIIVAIHQGMAFVFFAFVVWLTVRVFAYESARRIAATAAPVGIGA